MWVLFCGTKLGVRPVTGFRRSKHLWDLRGKIYFKIALVLANTRNTFSTIAKYESNTL